ncbi:MAG: serine/threonine-protein kinase [Cyanobacteria bacterium P01_F01_bin.33]
MTTPEVGTVLRSRYVLKAQLSKNATRQTWLAEDREQDRLVVVKMLAFNLQLQWQEVMLFEREAQALQRLEHPCIPKYLDYFTIEGKPDWMTLVQSYVPGESLQAKLDRGETFVEERLRQIATDVLTVLTYLHERQPPVLHRDIKPSNLIVGEGNQTYLVDFGAAQIQPAQMGTFTVVGTYGYTPMEQFGGRAVPASDLYSLGATLVHLATGIPPADLPQREFRLDYRDRVHLSLRFTQWLDKLIEPGVGDRYDSGHQAAQDIVCGNTATKLSSSFEDSPIPDSIILGLEVTELTTMSPWRSPISIGKSSRVKYQRTQSSLIIKFKKISFNEYFQSSSRTELKRSVSWQSRFMNYIMIIWPGVIFLFIVFAMFFLKISPFLPFVVFAIAYAVWISKNESDYKEHAPEIIFSLSKSGFDVFLADFKGAKRLFSEKVHAIARLEFFVAKKNAENDVLFDLMQIEIVKSDLSRSSVQLDTSLHPSELGWIQQNLNDDIQRFHQTWKQ